MPLTQKICFFVSVSIEVNNFDTFAGDHFTDVPVLIDHKSGPELFDAVFASCDTLVQRHVHLEMLVQN